MRTWPSEALAFESAVAEALDDLGGIDFARACELDPARRQALPAVLSGLGFDDLDVRAGEVEAAAAARGVRAAGAVITPWPVVQQLIATAWFSDGASVAYLTSEHHRRADHLDLFASGVVLDLTDARAYRVTPLPLPASRSRLDPFGVSWETGDEVAVDIDAAAADHMVLTAFYVLGALEHVQSLVAAYAVDRRQFGRSIVSFGAIQWRLADVGGLVSALSELAAFGLARRIDGTLTLADAAAARMQMVESALGVLTHAHQIMGAIGLCEEHDVAVIDRHLQAVLRRPMGVQGTAALLADRIDRDGFDGPYPIDPAGGGGARNGRVVHPAGTRRAGATR